MTEQNLIKVKERIRLVCSKINTNPDSISIVAVSKDRSQEQIKEAVEAGVIDIGENKVQEALLKYKQLLAISHKPLAIKWHMVGHLQSNKAKRAVKIFDLIQSVDSIHLALEIDRQAAKLNKIQDILVQINPVRKHISEDVNFSNGVNTSLKTTRFGLSPDEALEVITEIDKLKNINIKGLMTIAPMVDNPEKTRPYFRMLRELRDRINEQRATSNEQRILSMGMTDDFEVAIEEGSNMVRLGRAIFEG